MCHVQVLVLNNNKISDSGLTAFAKAVESGALPQLKELYLSDNQIGDVGMQALAGAVSKGPWHLAPTSAWVATAQRKLASRRCATQRRHVAFVCMSEFLYVEHVYDLTKGKGKG